MGNNKELGVEGEQLAADYLNGKGYLILNRNYRYRRAEIDIIAEKEKVLVFVEVKYRKNNDYGYPEQFVNEKKRRLIQSAAVNYMYRKKWPGNIRFDIISITSGKIVDIVHFEDAF